MIEDLNLKSKSEYHLALKLFLKDVTLPEEKKIFHEEVFKILKKEIGNKAIWGSYAKVNPFLKSASFVTENGTIRWRSSKKVTE